MALTRLSKPSAGSAPQKVELFYSINPDVFKPDPKVQATLIQYVKTEVMERFTNGESLAFRLSIADLCMVDVTPSGQGPPLPRRGNIEFIVRRRDSQNSSSSLVKEVSQFLLAENTYPAPHWQQRYEELVGLNGIKLHVLTSLRRLFSEEFTRAWQRKHHPYAPTDAPQEKPYPAFVFAGPPGVGKTEFAHAIGDPLARAIGSPVVSYSMSLALRGEGLVGQLSQNICKIFEFGKMQHLERGVPILLLIDEADAIGQERDGAQPQHHEESVGVNTLLQQIDLLREEPGVALIFTTNRHDALDAALRDRTNANWVSFPRPGFAARLHILTRLVGTHLPKDDLSALAWATEGLAPRAIGQLVERAKNAAVSLDRPLTQRHLLRAAAFLTRPSSSGRQGFRNGNLISMLPAPQGHKEFALHVNGHSS